MCRKLGQPDDFQLCWKVIGTIVVRDGVNSGIGLELFMWEFEFVTL